MDLPLKTRIVPRSLASRTLVTLLGGLIIVQTAGLIIHAYDRIELQSDQVLRSVAVHAMGVFRATARLPPAEREAAAQDLPPEVGGTAQYVPVPLPTTLPLATPYIDGTIRHNLTLVGMPESRRPTGMIVHGDIWQGHIQLALRYADRGWLDIDMPVQPIRPWHSPFFLLAFAMMTAAAAVLSIWAVRRLTGPVATLAAAAEALGRDVNAPPLPEDGPEEVARAAIAFNTMALRIRRFVQDRTLLLTAIGHDLRTPITRLKLRAEFLEDEAVRNKFLADLDDLDRMVAATLAFGRDTASDEPAMALDLMSLLRTVLDDAGDARPGTAEKLSLTGPAHLTMRGRSLSLKRAFANLINNAIAYGGSADIVVRATPQNIIVTITDDGPGVPQDQAERVFDPFFRLEESRNRDTGGTGLGLPIARNILRAHGGDVSIGNAAMRGAMVTVTLPA
jgi:signal transduction histidine kinase